MPSLLSQFLPRVSSIWELNSRAEAGVDFAGRANDGVADAAAQAGGELVLLVSGRRASEGAAELKDRAQAARPGKRLGEMKERARLVSEYPDREEQRREGEARRTLAMAEAVSRRRAVPRWGEARRQ